MYAPEHLILNTEDAEEWLDDIESAGSVFLGRYTPESMGDYASGTNHVLPTYGYAAVAMTLLTFSTLHLFSHMILCFVVDLSFDDEMPFFGKFELYLVMRERGCTIKLFCSSAVRYARMYSGVSLDSFQKKITVQNLTQEGLMNLGPAVAHMAAVEGLDAHRRAVTLRMGLES
jgi:histidinol dehydrogenase